MKQYPSIPAGIGTQFGTQFFEFEAHCWEKLDGKNLRMKWTRKKGFCQFGSRHRLFDQTDPEFGPSIPIFQTTIAEPLAKILTDARLQEAILFGELWGDKSFAGFFEPGDPLRVSLFDACWDKKGFLSPQDFRRAFEGKVPTPAYLGLHHWTRGFVEQVFRGEIEGTSFEGVGGKTKAKGGELLMAKAKTRGWLEAVKARFDSSKAEELINS